MLGSAARRPSSWMLLCLLVPLLVSFPTSCRGFVAPSQITTDRSTKRQHLAQQTTTSISTTVLRLSYVPPEQSEPTLTKKTPPKKKPLLPRVGDIVRYYDLDGGKADGQVLVGKISFIQKQLQSETSTSRGSGWLVELTQLEDTGDGYYAEYSTRQRRSTTLRDLSAVSPIAASWVRTESAFKIPLEKDAVTPAVRAPSYDLEDYQGPVINIDETVVQADDLLYQALKGRLLRYAAIVGLAGTVVADLVKGTESAVIYGAGVVASLAYLFLLSVKTDTLARPDSKMGSNISNARFAMPLLVLVAIALYNQSLGDANPVYGKGTFDYVTPEQFAAAVLGFFTYRLPLFAIPVQDFMTDTESDFVLPGSAGVAMQLAKGDEAAEGGGAMAPALTTIFLVSGPQATGRSELVKRLIQDGEGRFEEPNKIDKVKDPVKFERIQQRDEFLSIDPSGRFGYTKESILSSSGSDDSVVVVDADVELARKLLKVGGLRIVGVWVGLNSVEEFEQRLEAQIDSGEIPLPEDETKESLIRARIKEIVKEIEFGLSSGIFEFTILNKDEESSVKQLKEAAAYCF